MTRGSRGKYGLVVVAFGLLLSATFPTAVTGATVADPTEGPDAVTAPGDDRPDLRQQRPPENNTTVAHRNPSEVSGERNLSDVRNWLERELSGRLSESVNVSQADRERAQELIGNDSEYAQLAEQYRNVSSDNESPSADDLPKFSVLASLQREFLGQVRQYRSTRARYQHARRNNSTLRERRLAHELGDLSRSINRTARRLGRTYDNLSAERQNRLQNVPETIEQMRANVTQTTLRVREQSLVRTVLTVRTEESTASFADPATFVGRLRTENGTPVAGERVTLYIGNQTLDATTDSRGGFSVEYRPTFTSVGDRQRRIEYRPANDSAYATDSATVRFTVRRVAPALRISNLSANARYDEPVVVNGSVSADDVGVAGLPLNVTVDGVTVAQVRTGPNGSFGAAARLPANVSTGAQQLRVEFDPDSMNGTSAAGGSTRRSIALAATNSSASLRVRSTPTDLSILDVNRLEDTAFVSGRLTTADGTPVPNRTVELRIGGATVGETTTNSTGGFATTVAIATNRTVDNSTVELVVVNPSDGNLGRSRATASVSVSPSSTGLPGERVLFGVAGLVGIAAFGVVVWRLRSTDDELAREGAPDIAAATGPGVGTYDADPTETLEAARTALEDERFDEATVSAYVLARHHLRGVADANPRSPRTHRELYEDLRDADFPSDELHRLDRLSRVYERAAFASGSVSGDEAAEAVDIARSFADVADDRSSSSDSVRPGPSDDSPAA